MKNIIILNFIFLIAIGNIYPQDFFEYINYFLSDISTFNQQLSKSMADRIPIVANIGPMDASTNLSGHLFTIGISIGSALTPDFYSSLTKDASYNLIDINNDIGVPSDLNYLPLPSLNIFGKFKTFTGWDISARFGYIPFDTKDFHYNSFTFSFGLNHSILNFGNESGLSISPFFTYSKGSATYTSNEFSLPFEIANINFSLDSQLDFQLDWNLSSLGIETKVSKSLLFFHPFVGSMIFTNWGNASVSTTPTINIRMINPPRLLLKEKKDLIKKESSPQAFLLNVFGGAELSILALKLGIRLDYELLTSAFSFQIGFRLII